MAIPVAYPTDPIGFTTSCNKECLSQAKPQRVPPNSIYPINSIDSLNNINTILRRQHIHTNPPMSRLHSNSPISLLRHSIPSQASSLHPPPPLPHCATMTKVSQLGSHLLVAQWHICREGARSLASNTNPNDRSAKRLSCNDLGAHRRLFVPAGPTIVCSVPVF